MSAAAAFMFGIATGIGLGGIFRAIEQWDQRRFEGTPNKDAPDGK